MELIDNDKHSRLLRINRTVRFKKCKQLFDYQLYSYLETSGGQNSHLYLNVVYFLTPALNRHLWQLKAVIFLHWCLLWTEAVFLVTYDPPMNDL
jgi:hypothetical protein